MLKLSRYTLFYEDYPKPGQYLVFNTRTQAVMVINRQTKDILDRKLSTRDRKVILDYLPADEAEGFKLLKESGIIVDERVDEAELMEEFFNRLRCRPKPLQATILTTYKCNFACSYCFEERVKHPFSMERRMCSDVVTWLKGRVEAKQRSVSGVPNEASGRSVSGVPKVVTKWRQSAMAPEALTSGPSSLRLTFYGGEPLMNTSAIDDITLDLQPWCAERGLKFSFGLITNGSLITERIVDRLITRGLKTIRVTLDGDREHHDRRRPFLDGRGSFDRIIANLEPIIDRADCHSRVGCVSRCGGTKWHSSAKNGNPDSCLRRNDGSGGEPPRVRVEIGGTFDRDNLDSYRRLLDFMDARGWNKKIHRLILAPVIDRLGANGPSRIPVEMVGCHSFTSELAEDALKLHQEIIQRGYRVDSSVTVSVCPMTTYGDSAVVIDPYGDLYKCEGFVGRTQFAVGNVRDTVFNERLAEFCELKPWRDANCLDCAFLPMCGGGCRLMAQLKHSDYAKPACEMEYYKNIFPRLLKMDYERGLLSTPA